MELSEVWDHWQGLHSVRRGLHPPRHPAFRPVGHRPGPQRRGAHHHPVPRRPGPRPGLEGPGVVRRVRLLGPAPPPVRASPAASTACPTAPGTATRVWAGDDTKVHRNSKDVWGTCTFHEYTARCPNRASTVRAHNWVVLGALLPQPGPARPTSCPSPAGCTSARRSCPPPRRGRRSSSAPSASCWSRWPASTPRPAAARPWASSTAASPCAAWSGPWSAPAEPGQPRIDFLTRLRHDARLHALPPAGRKQGPAGADAEVGQAAAAAQARGALAGRVADGHGVHLRPRARGPLQGGAVPVARAGPRRGGQGGGGRGGGLQQALHAGHQRHST